jgi:hypothetical protein
MSAAMTSTAVVRMDRARARSLTKKLAAATDLLLDAVVEAYEGQAWSVLGFDSWAAYVAAEVPGLAVIGKGLPVEQRREAVAVLRGRGLSLRGVSDVLGIAPNTVRTDAAAAGVVLTAVKSRDGALRPAVAAAPPARPRPLTDRLVAAVRDAGGEGTTVLELCDRLRVRQSRIAPALVRLDRAGRVSYLRPAKRGQLGRYVAG